MLGKATSSFLITLIPLAAFLIFLFKFKPLYKKEWKADPKSILLVSEAVEKLIHNQTKNFPNKNKILDKSQSNRF